LLFHFPSNISKRECLCLKSIFRICWLKKEKETASGTVIAQNCKALTLETYHAGFMSGPVVIACAVLAVACVLIGVVPVGGCIILHNNTESYRIIHNLAEYYRIIQNLAE
jgi:hypothetical protein